MKFDLLVEKLILKAIRFNQLTLNHKIQFFRVSISKIKDALL